jgi:hypothetical protein
VTGCTTYKQIEVGEVGSVERVRVTTLDGQVREVSNPAISADTLRGGAFDARIALADIEEVSVKGTDVASTTSLVLFAVGVTAGLVYGIGSAWLSESIP